MRTITLTASLRRGFYVRTCRCTCFSLASPGLSNTSTLIRLSEMVSFPLFPERNLLTWTLDCLFPPPLGPWSLNYHLTFQPLEFVLDLQALWLAPPNRNSTLNVQMLLLSTVHPAGHHLPPCLPSQTPRKWVPYLQSSFITYSLRFWPYNLIRLSLKLCITFL